MKGYIAQVSQNTQPISHQPQNGAISPDWILIAIAGITGFCTQYLPKIGSALANSPLTSKIIGVKVAEQLTENTIELQKAEAEIDERESFLKMIREVLGILQTSVSEQQKEVMALFKMSMEHQKLHAEAAQTQSAIASRIETIAGSIADALTTLNLSKERFHKEVVEKLKEVSEGQELAQENLAAAVTAITGKIEVIFDKINIILENLDELKKGDQLIEANFIRSIRDLKDELASAIASLR